MLYYTFIVLFVLIWNYVIQHEYIDDNINNYDSNILNNTILNNTYHNNKVKPNIIIIVADDLGWNDVGYHGSKFPTTNIDRLSNNGIRLENYYVHTTCTPSRGSMLTGKFASNIGLNTAMLAYSPYGITKEHITISERLKNDYNYTNYYIGKWHLGFSKRSLTPLGKKYDHYFGMYNGAATHYEQKLERLHDLNRNGEPIINYNKTYSADLYTNEAIELIDKHDINKPFHMVLSHQVVHTPLEEAPLKYRTKCKNITHRLRYIMCSMAISLDESVYKIENILKNNNLWENTIILFTTDNGGQPYFGSSNYPYRSGKRSLFEGGLKGVAFLSGGYIEERKSTNIYNGLMHIADINPTLLHLVDSDITDEFNKENYNIDGIIMTDNILNNIVITNRSLLLHNDPYESLSCIRYNNWKLIDGFAGDPNIYVNYDNKILFDKRLAGIIGHFLIGAMGHESFFFDELIRETIIDLRYRYPTALYYTILDYFYTLYDYIFGTNYSSISSYIRLYDIINDPYERNNIARKHPELIKDLKEEIKKLQNPKQQQYDWFVIATNYNNLLVNDTLFAVPWMHDNDSQEFSTSNFLTFYGKVIALKMKEQIHNNISMLILLFVTIVTVKIW